MRGYGRQRSSHAAAFAVSPSSAVKFTTAAAAGGDLVKSMTPPGDGAAAGGAAVETVSVLSNSTESPLHSMLCARSRRAESSSAIIGIFAASASLMGGEERTRL